MVPVGSTSRQTAFRDQHSEHSSLAGYLVYEHWLQCCMTGRPNVVLWNPAADSFPADLEFARPLDHPRVRPILRTAARTIGYASTV